MAGEDEVGDVGQPVPGVGRGEQVLADGEVVEQLQRLEGAGETGPRAAVRRPAGDVRAVPGHRAGREPVVAGHTVDQRGLAGAVRPEQPDHLTGTDGEVDVVERGETAEPLGQPGHRERARRHRGALGGRQRLGRARAKARDPRTEPPGEGVDPLGDAVLVEDQHHQQQDAGGDREVLLPRRGLFEGGVRRVVRRGQGDQAVGGEQRAQHRSGQVAGAADHGQHQHADRRVRPEDRVEEDRAGAEAEQHAAQPGDAGRQREAVQLRLEDVDADGGRSALVGAYGEQPAAGAAAPQVGHRERGDRQERKTHDRVVARVPDGIDRPSEEGQVGGLHPGVLGVGAVAEDQLVHGEAEAERDDCEVHATGPQRRQAEEEPDGRGDEHTDHQGGLEPPPVRRHQLGRREGADAGQGVLRQRELAGVAGQHHHGEADDRERRADDDGCVPVLRRTERHPQERGGGDDDDHARPDPAGADPGEPVGDASAQRQPAAPDDQHHDDHQERHRVGDAGTVRGLEEVVAPVRGQRLRDTEEDAAQQRQRVGLETAQQRGRERADDEDAEGDRRDEAGRGRRHQRPGHGGQATADAPGHGGQQVGRPAESGRGARVLGGRGDRVAEPGPGARDGEQEGHHRRDRHQVEAVAADDDVARQGDRLGGDGRVGDDLLGAELEHDGLAEHGEDAEGRYDARQRARRTQRPHHQEVDRHSQHRTAHDRGGQREEGAVAADHLEPVGEVGADEGEAGLGEVDDAGAAVDHHEAEAEQRVDAAGPEAEQREAEQVGHASGVFMVVGSHL